MAEQSMPYKNPFLLNFVPIFLEILKQKNINPKTLEYVFIDEEADGHHAFEEADVKDVLEQLCDEMNALTIYTNREGYFSKFVYDVCEENGLIVTLLPKSELSRANFNGGKINSVMILDFEWEGNCYILKNNYRCFYIPIHKKPWKLGKNLDIIVPFGYNTVIVKRTLMTKKVFVSDRFDEGFYRNE